MCSSEVNRTEVAHSRLIFGGIEEDLCAEIRAVDDPYVILRRADIRRIFKCDPRMACFKEHAEHFAPKLRALRSLLKSLIFPALPFSHIRHTAFQRQRRKDRGDQAHRLG